MRKITAIVLAGMMAFSLAGCSTASNATTAATTVATEAATEATTAAETTAAETTAAETEAEKPEFITVACLNGASEEVELEVPVDPQTIVTLDAASTDILANLGLADRIVGTTTPEAYLAEFVADAENVGTAKTFDVEAIMELEPELIFMAGRGSDFYDTLAEIAPVVRLTVSGAVVEGTYTNSLKIASIFGLEDEMEAKLGAYDERIAAIQEVAK